MQDREEKLRQRILEMAHTCGDKKWKRVKRTFLVLSGAIYLLVFMYGKEINDIKDFLTILIGVPIASGFIMFIAYAILAYIITGALEEEKAIARLEGELNAIKFSDKKEKEVE
jgi:hypothetical protein